MGKNLHKDLHSRKLERIPVQTQWNKIKNTDVQVDQEILMLIPHSLHSFEYVGSAGYGPYS